MSTYLKHIDLKNHVILSFIWLFFVLNLIEAYPHQMIVSVFLSLSLFWLLITLSKERLNGKMLYIYITMWISMLLCYGVIFVDLLFIFVLPLMASTIYIGIHLYKHPSVFKTNLNAHESLYQGWMKLLWLIVFVLIFKTSLMWMLIPLSVCFIIDISFLMKEMKLFEQRMPLFILTFIMFILAYLSTSVDTDGSRAYNILFNIAYTIFFLLSMIHLSWMKKTYQKHMSETKEKKIKA